MKDFRIAKCLVNDKDGNPEIRRYAIFKNGTPKHPIETDDEGREYFSVPNWVQNDLEMDRFNYRNSMLNYMKYSFTGKPKDMISSIRRGDGDVIIRGFLGLENVLYFLDRDYGESLRKKTLEGWRGAKFAYGLYCDSISVNTNGKFEFGKHDIYFDSAKDAIDLATKIAEEAYQKAFSLAGLPWKYDAEYLSFLGDAKDPNERIVFNCLLNDVYEEGETLTFRDNVSVQNAMRLFKIRQEVVKEDK